MGIVPPEEYKEKIISFQRKWNKHLLCELAEPHITVKTQAGLTSDERWLEKAEEYTAQCPAFSVRLCEPEWFGKNVVYLSVKGRFLYDLHNNWVDIIFPDPKLSHRYFEKEHYIPHLTLGQTVHGLTEKELLEMEIKAEHLLHPYPAFVAEYIRVYKQKEDGRYRKYTDLPLLK